MKIPLRIRVLWHNYDENYYQEMYLTKTQFEELLHDSTNGLNDVSGDDHHENTYKRIKAEIKNKIKY